MLKKNIILKSVICAFLILISGIAVSAQGGGALGAGCRDDVWSAEITLNPSTIQAGQQGTATVTITGASPGGFAINLQGAATGSSGTVVWCTIPVPGGNPCPGGNICQSRYTIPFTAVSSGNVEVYIPHRGQVIGSAPLIVTGSATTTSTTSGTGSSSTSAATTTSSGSTSSTTPQIYVRRVDGVSGDGPQGTVSCEVGDLRIGDCQDIGYRFNHGCDATSERTCRAWERVGNLGAAGCLIICQRGGGTIAGTTTGGTGSATTGGTTGSTGGTSTATTTASCPAGYSASVSFPPVSAGQTGNAQVTLIGVRPPGNFIIYLRGAANNGDVPPTIFIDNWESRFVDNNPCVTRHTVPFTAGSSSGQVQAHLNFFGGFGTNIAPASTQLTLGQASGTPAGTVITPQPPPVVTGTTVSSPIVGSSVPFDIRGSNFGTNRGRIEFLDASNNPSGTFIESNVANRWNLEWRSDSQIVVTMLQGQTQSWTPNVQGTIRFRVINANGVPSGPSQVTFTPLPAGGTTGGTIGTATAVASSSQVTISWNVPAGTTGNTGNSAAAYIWPTATGSFATSQSRGTNPGPSNNGNQPGTSGSNTFAGLQPDTLYSFRVRGFICPRPAVSPCGNDYDIAQGTFRTLPAGAAGTTTITSGTTVLATISASNSLRLRGSLDQIQPNIISGWACEPGNSGPISVRVYFRDNVETITTQQFDLLARYNRPDSATGGCTGTMHGFSLNPSSIVGLGAATYTVSVRAVPAGTEFDSVDPALTQSLYFTRQVSDGEGGTMLSPSFPLNVPAGPLPPPAQDFLGHVVVEPNRISGWACARGDGSGKDVLLRLTNTQTNAVREIVTQASSPRTETGFETNSECTGINHGFSSEPSNLALGLALTNTPAGQYRVTAFFRNQDGTIGQAIRVTDWPGNNPNNNLITIPFSTGATPPPSGTTPSGAGAGTTPPPTNAPDLVIPRSLLRIGGSDGGSSRIANRPFPFQITTSNIGSVSVPSSQTIFARYTVTDGSRTIVPDNFYSISGGINAGSSHQDSITLTIPAGLFTLTICADHDNRVIETNEGNNCVQSTVDAQESSTAATVSQPAPVISSVSAPSSVTAGTLVTITILGTNFGNNPGAIELQQTNGQFAPIFTSSVNNRWVLEWRNDRVVLTFVEEQTRSWAGSTTFRFRIRNGGNNLASNEWSVPFSVTAAGTGTGGATTPPQTFQGNLDSVNLASTTLPPIFGWACGIANPNSLGVIVQIWNNPNRQEPVVDNILLTADGPRADQAALNNVCGITRAGTAGQGSGFSVPASRLSGLASGVTYYATACIASSPTQCVAQLPVPSQNSFVISPPTTPPASTPQPPPVVTGTTVSSPIVGSSVPFDIRGSNFGTNRGRIEFLDASNNPSGTFIESNVANRWNLEWRSDSQIVVTMLQGQTQSWTPNVQGTIRFRVINANGVPSGPSQVTFTPLPGPVVSGVGVSPSTIVRSSEGVNVRFLISGSGFGNNPGTMELLDTSENLIQSFPQSTLFSNGVLVFRRTVWVDNQIIVDLFPPLTSNLGTGTRNFKVRIRTSNGVLSGPSPQFSYTVVEPPAIVSVNVEPTTVQRRQPLTFTITGSNFGNNPGSIQVLDINENNWGSPLNLQNNPSGLSTNWGDTQIIVRLLEVSNNAPLGYNAFRLKVITSGGVSSPSSNVFTYTVNPASTPTTAPPPPPSLPDLVAEVDAVSGSIYAGVPVNLRGRIRNIGQGIAQPSTAMFNIFRGGETIIPPTNYNIASVAPNAAVPDIVARYSFTGPGTYFITLCANRDGAIQETNSINNCFGRNFEVQAPGAGSFVTATGCSIPSGQSSCAASVTWESRSVPPGETPGIWVYVPSLNFRRSGAEFGCAGASGSCSRPVGVANYIIKLHRDVSNPESQVFAEASMAVTS